MGAARRGLHERTHNFRCGIPSSTRSCGPKGQCPRRSPGPTAGLDRPRTASCCAYTVTEICRPCTVHLAQWRCRCSLRVWPSHRSEGKQGSNDHRSTRLQAISTSIFSCNVWDRRRNRTRTRTLVQNFTKSVGGHRHAPQPAVPAAQHTLRSGDTLRPGPGGWLAEGRNGKLEGTKGRRDRARGAGGGRPARLDADRTGARRPEAKQPPPSALARAKPHANERSRRRTKLRGRPVYSPQVNYKYYLSSWFPLFQVSFISAESRGCTDTCATRVQRLVEDIVRVNWSGPGKQR